MTLKKYCIKKFWNGKDVSNAGLKTQLELGKLETNTKRIRIECRDHSYVDGDRVKLYVNEKIIRRSITLQGGYYAIDIDLLEGFNRIDIEALNQGSSVRTLQNLGFMMDMAIYLLIRNGIF